MNPCHYKLAVFDLDGTLLDTSRGIADALAHTLKHFGCNDCQAADLSAYIGPPIEVALRDILGLKQSALSAAAAHFRHRYRTKDLLKARPYNGIFELLEALHLHGVTAAIATYKREDYAKELLSHFGFDRHISTVYGSDANGLLKKSDLIRQCMTTSGITEPQNAVMIGDTREDARGAMDTGVDFIAVTYGFGFQKKKDTAPYQTLGVANSPAEILPYILKGE